MNKVLFKMGNRVQKALDRFILIAAMSLTLYITLLIVGIDVPFILVVFGMCVIYAGIVLISLAFLGILVVLRDAFGVLVQFRSPIKISKVK